MAVEVTKGTVRHDGIVYKVGEIIHDISDQAKADLIKFGVVKDLNADQTQVEDQVKTDEQTVKTQAEQDEELARGQVEDQVKDAVAGDLADAEKLANTPGQVVVNGKPTSQTVPTAEEIANDPQVNSQ